MSNRITKAFADYLAETTAASVRKSVRTCKTLGYPQSAADIRWSAAMTFRDALNAEIARY